MSGRRIFIGGQVDKKLKAEFVSCCGREVWENGRPVKISQNKLLLIFLNEGVEQRTKGGSARRVPQGQARAIAG